ncbi:GNAT family N-acetyltransferase [Cellvibrio fontiphilus]|uniref:GNAT family N-acetyltransferase n=1 Tax=Cellvibrio fontiphilus TaxID=1815559 RepID=A0ABV7FAF7_9GAMM
MQIRFTSSILSLEPAAWNALCPADYPFIRHEFLAALELSGCTTGQSGWQPYHLLVEAAGQLIAVMPGYIKHHSYGEYVFDWAWADAYRRHGLDYYPKWICAIPFSPCYGPRLLMAQGVAMADILPQISAALGRESLAQGWSGWHCLFPDKTLSDCLHQQGALQRLGCQFHWENRGYRDFADFAASMNSRKRKNILKERRQVSEQGFTFVVKTGRQLEPEDWQTFYALYRTTYLKRSGHKGYLSADFFQLLGATMGDQLVMICAVKADDPAQAIIAASLFVRDSQCLYGRYWGCFEEYQFLHFETCYYQGIDYAIAQQLARFDGGAQGEHKIPRGFAPRFTYSNHWVAEPGFRAAIAQFLQQEAAGITQYAAEAATLLPFKQAD